jgi:hypothetical protein
MHTARLLLVAAFCGTSAPALAIEGSTLAGPIGGTDIRSAQLPPPGLYGGIAFLAAEAFDFVDAQGNTVPALRDIDLWRMRTGPFLVYVPDFQLFGGSIGLLGVVPNGVECGHLFAITPTRCIAGLGDPYVEIAWSRFFGTVRPSRYPGAFPIQEGLTLAAGFGVVIPVGRYDPFAANIQGVTIGNNIWDFAPNVAFTYMTRPIIAEGTEISAKLFWNNYLTNPATQYTTGTVLNLDFAVSERIGRFQIGAGGFYAFQIEDDKQFGIQVPPDGRRGETLQVGPIISYDMPELAATIKFKALTTVFSENAVLARGFVVTVARKLY